MKNLGAIFLKKKSACGNVGAHPGLPEIWGPFFWKKIGLGVPKSSPWLKKMTNFLAMGFGGGGEM